MDFSDLIALKIKELMEESNITIYILQDLSGVTVQLSQCSSIKKLKL